MEFFGIKFAPLNIPLERRLQTLSAGTWLITLLFGGFVGPLMVLYLIIFTKLWWIAILYLLWMWFIDRDICEKGGRPVQWVRSWIWWRYTRDYFPLRFEKVSGVELDPKKNYLFCCFPHGLLSAGVFNAFGAGHSEFKSYFPYHQTHVVTLSLHYIIPLYREIALSLGGISASAKAIDYVLARPEGGHVVCLIVGGVAEARCYKPGEYGLVLKRRKGFVRLALKNGTPLVPVLSFGETDLFDQLSRSRLRYFQEILCKKIGLTPFIPIGRGFFQYSFGIIPHRRPVVTVAGRPIDVPKVVDPTSEQIEDYHKKFIDSLIALFEEQKYNYLENPEEKKIVLEG